MIAADQFTNLPDNLLFVFSSKEDGSVLDRTKSVHDEQYVQVRSQICRDAGIDYDQVVYQRIIYDENASYSLIADVDARSTTNFTSEVVADGLFTKQRGVGLFLPVADCIVTVIYDPQKHFLAQLHMGRHSTLSDILPRMFRKFSCEGSDITNLLVWMAPAATRQTYRLEYFDLADTPEWCGYVDKKADGYYLDMQGYNREACIAAGVQPDNITISRVDTVRDDHYFSHSAGDVHGRFAGLAMMR